MHRLAHRSTRLRPRRQFYTPLRVERLEQRTLLATGNTIVFSPEHNALVPFDVTGEGQVTPNDALSVINYINAFGSGPAPSTTVPPYCDTNADKTISPADALDIINFVNAGGSAALPISPLTQDYGFAAISGAQHSETYSIRNQYPTPLHLSTPQIVGAAAADFLLAKSPDAVLAPGATTSLTLRFDPSATGVRAATISIPNDSGLAISSFALKGTGVLVQGIAAAEPGTLETVTLGGVPIDPAATTSLVFHDPSGIESKAFVKPLAVAGGYSIQFIVPTYWSPTTLLASAGTVELGLEQATAIGNLTINLGSLAISNLPQTGLPTGTLVNDFLDQLLQLLSTEIADAQAIHATGFVDLSANINQLQSLQSQLAGTQQRLASLANGQMSRIAFGQINGSDSGLDLNSLAEMDRILAGIANNSGLGTAGNTFPSAAFATSTLSGEGDLAIANVRTNLTHIFDKIKGINGPNAEQGWRTLSSLSGVAGATLGLAEAVGVGGAIVTFGAPIATGLAIGFALDAAIVVARQHGGFDTILNPSTHKEDFQEIKRAAIESGVDIAMTLTFDEAAEAMKEYKILAPDGEAVTHLIDYAVNLHNTVRDESVSAKLIQYFDTLYDRLTRPQIGVDKSSLLFQVFIGASSPGQGITISNTGHGTLNYSVTPSKGQIQVTGGPHPLAAGQSETLNVTVNTNGLLAGEYDETITIADSNALNSPIIISVTIFTFTGRASINPTSLSGTVEQGVTASGNFTVQNVGQAGTTLRYTFVPSDNNVSVTGSPTPLAAGQSASFKVNVNTTDLPPRSQPYYFHVYVFNTDYAPSDSNGLSILDVDVTVIAKPAVIKVNPTSLSFTATAGASMANEAIDVQIINAGPAGSELTYQLTDDCYGRLKVAGYQTILPSNYYDLRTFTFDTSGLAANIYGCNLYVSSSDSRVSQVIVPIKITVGGTSDPAWGAYESGDNGRSSDQWYSVTSAQFTIRFYMQPFGIPDRFTVTDDSGHVYLDSGYISTQDNGFEVPRSQQHPYYYDFVKPAGVTRLRVQVFANSDNNTGWWYYGRTPTQLWY